LTQGLIDLTGDTSQQLFPRHGESLTAQPPENQARMTATNFGG
jgi:hypothetical protein